MALFNERHIQSSKHKEDLIDIRHSSDEVYSQKTGKRAYAGKMSGQITPEQIFPKQVLALLSVLDLVVLSFSVLLCLSKFPKLDLLLTAHVLHLSIVDSEGIRASSSTADAVSFSFIFLLFFLLLFLIIIIWLIL